LATAHYPQKTNLTATGNIPSNHKFVNVLFNKCNSLCLEIKSATKHFPFLKEKCFVALLLK